MDDWEIRTRLQNHFPQRVRAHRAKVLGQAIASGAPLSLARNAADAETASHYRRRLADFCKDYPQHSALARRVARDNIKGFRA
ncbi:hypothetical protein [Shimia sp. MIT1388]|uniref:hypothetical protein n=1 Tax=Shimia sp. MIT1388 TaxID=3096992 RepID=UPI003999C56F